MNRIFDVILFITIFVFSIQTKGDNMKNYNGQRFGRITVISDAPSYTQPNGAKVRKVNVRCDCGTTKTVNLYALKSGAIVSCGCYQKENLSKSAGANKIPISEYIGKKFNLLTIIGEATPRIRNNGGVRRYVRCKCDCGNEKVVNLDNLKRGLVYSCGSQCKLRKPAQRKTYEELIGAKFGELTVISVEPREKYKDPIVKCRCSCGNEKFINVFSLKRINSCGCVKGKHNKSSTKLYDTWINIKQRCLNKNNKRYKNYGGRGITICKEWETDFMAFYNWAMNNGYKEYLTIDRINNDGNYEPDNCQWIPHKLNSLKRRTNKNYETLNNKRFTL